MEANLYNKGDFVEYDVTIENKGTFDAKLDDIITSVKSNNEAVKITFSGYTKGQILQKGTTQTVKVKIEYNPDYEGEGEGSGEVSVDFEYSQNEGGTIVPSEDYLVTYDCETNGGNSCSSYNEYLPTGSDVNLSYSSEKTGYEFVGWNTNKDAKEGINSLTINDSNITLYAIYKKTITVTYEKGTGVSSIGKNSDTCLMYNNDKSCNVTLPSISVNSGYSVDGWYNGNTKVGSPNSSYSVSSNVKLTAKGLLLDNEGPTVKFDPNSQSNYTNGTAVDITLEDETGIKEGQEISYMWSTSNTESPFTEGSTALGEVNGTDIDLSILGAPDDISVYDYVKDGASWVNTNHGIANSYSALLVTFTLEQTATFSFNYDMSCTEDSCMMGYFITSNNEIVDVNQFSGTNSNMITESLEAGTYDIYILYFTAGVDENNDTLKINNIIIDGLPIEGTPIQTAEGAKTATINVPKNLSSSYTGTYYLWVKGGIEDTLGNVSEDKVSGAFKFDNSSPTLSVSSSSTTNSITVTANAYSISGITKYEFSMDYGKTWHESDSNVYTFTGLEADTMYYIDVRVTNGIGKTATGYGDISTKEIPIPTFSETGDSELKTVTITYPEGCGSTYTCSYIKDNGEQVEVTSQTVNVEFTSDGTLIGIVSDGNSENGNVYEVEMTGTMRSWAGSSTSDFHSSTYKSKITSAEVVDYKTVPEDAVRSWDVSEKGNGSVMAWVVNDPERSGYYKLYIGGNGGVKANEDSSDIFSNFSSLGTVDLTKLDTSKVTDVSFMFYGCSSLTSLDVSGFDTSNVIDMKNMFAYCSSLTSLDLSNFDTSKVTNMSYMFSGATQGYVEVTMNLKNIIFGEKWDTSNVRYMSRMFAKCSKLSSLDLSNFDTGKVTDMSYMFYGCSSLTSLDVSSFDTSDVTNMRSMFYNCSSLTSLNLSNFDTSNVTDMSYMFYGCSSLTSLDVSSFDTSDVTNMLGMFYNCSSLTSLDLSNFDTSNVTDMSYMFYGASKLKTIYVGPNWTTANATTTSMFSNCGVSSVTQKS